MKQQNMRSLFCGLCAAMLVVGCLLPQTALAQKSRQRLPAKLYKNGSAVRAAFRNVVAQANQVTVQVRCDGEEVSLGTIVGKEGWILTKASELEGSITCVLADGRELPAKLVGVHDKTDLAMIQVDAKDLPEADWSDKDPQVGAWLASVAPKEGSVAAGVLSVPRRKISGSSGVLGISIDREGESTRITQVAPNSGAAEAGLQVDDLVTHINGRKVDDAAALANAIRKHKPGDEIKLRIKREEEELELTAKLGKRTPSRRQAFQNRLGGSISRRRNDFPAVLQHDSLLKPTECGGPVVDLSGKVVGINIARAGRTESFALPGDVVRGLIADLQSGKLAPPAAETQPVTNEEKSQ